jgi:hypothetical protein
VLGTLVAPAQLFPVTLYPADGAITIATGIAKLTKGSIAAMTLAAPTVAQEGTELTITSASAFAHVVTATGAIQNGVTGGAKTTITFAAFIGASITLLAVTNVAGTAAFWHVKGLSNAPVT